MVHRYSFIIFDVGSTLIEFTQAAPFRRFLQDVQPERRIAAAEGRAYTTCAIC